MKNLFTQTRCQVSNLAPAILSVFAAAAVLGACASTGGGGGALPGPGTLKGYMGKSSSELEARLGAPARTVSDGRGGKILTWSKSRYDFGSGGGESPFGSSARYGSRTDIQEAKESREESGTVVTELQIWVDAQDRIYDFKRETFRGD